MNNHLRVKNYSRLSIKLCRSCSCCWYFICRFTNEFWCSILEMLGIMFTIDWIDWFADCALCTSCSWNGGLGTATGTTLLYLFTSKANRSISPSYSEIMALLSFSFLTPESINLIVSFLICSYLALLTLGLIPIKSNFFLNLTYSS